MTVESRRALGSRYELHDLLGSGAMGQVWRTLDRTSGRFVAAKLLRTEYVRDPEILTRFIQERSILIGLRHPNIVEVHDLVVEGDDLAIVMDLIAGPTLAQYLATCGTLAPAAALDVAVAVLDGLAEAHSHHALHRDVKPENVMLTTTQRPSGAQVKLTDFSIARLAQESTVQATGLLGTPAYMPPELFTKGQFSAASDVYAAGVLLYELLAGRTPFAGVGTAHTVGFRHVTAAPPVLAVPERLWSALATMLDKDPARRLPAATTADLLRELRPALADVAALPVQVEPATWTEVPAGATDPGIADPGGPIRVSPAVAADPGATNLRAELEPAPAAVIAGPGQVRAAVPVADVAGRGDATQLGTPVERATVPTLTPEVTLPAGGRRRWKVLVGVAGAVVVLTAAVLLLTGVLSSGSHPAAHPTSAPTGVSAAVSDEGTSAATGFAETAGATFDAASSSAVVTFKLTMPSTQAAPVLLVLPPLTRGSTCTDVTWTGDVGSPPTSLSGQNASSPVLCGWSVLPAAGRAGASITATVPSSSALTTDQLQQWLSSVDAATTTALQSVQGTDFAAQRLTAISVVPLRPLAALGFRTKIPFEILPTWVGQQGAATADPLYATASDGSFAGSPTEAWTAVTGSTDIDTAVSGAQNVSVTGGEITTGSQPGTAQFTIKINNELQAPFTATVAGPAS